MQNRQAILSIGSQIQNAERNFQEQLQSGTQTTEIGGLQRNYQRSTCGAGTAFGLMNAFGGLGGNTKPSADMGNSMFGGSTPFASGSYLGGLFTSSCRVLFKPLFYNE